MPTIQAGCHRFFPACPFSANRWENLAKVWLPIAEIKKQDKQKEGGATAALTRRGVRQLFEPDNAADDKWAADVQPAKAQPEAKPTAS